MRHGRQTLFGTLLGHSNHHQLILLHYFGYSIATLERREASSRRTGGKASRLASATEMPVTRLRRSAAPRLGAEDANEAEATNPRTVTRRGNEEDYAV